MRAGTVACGVSGTTRRHTCKWSPSQRNAIQKRPTEFYFFNATFEIVFRNAKLFVRFLRILPIKVKEKLATLVEFDPNAPFSIATTPRRRGGRYSISMD